MKKSKLTLIIIIIIIKKRDLSENRLNGTISSLPSSIDDL